eukprot:jgi/Chrzof1/5612/Cz16g08330.t1
MSHHEQYADSCTHASPHVQQGVADGVAYMAAMDDAACRAAITDCMAAVAACMAALADCMAKVADDDDAVGGCRTCKGRQMTSHMSIAMLNCSCSGLHVMCREHQHCCHTSLFQA